MAGIFGVLLLCCQNGYGSKTDILVVAGPGPIVHAHIRKGIAVGEKLVRVRKL